MTGARDRRPAARAGAVAVIVLAAVIGLQVAPVMLVDSDGIASAAPADEKWSSSTGYQVDSSPTVVDGTVYVGSSDNNVYAFDAADGSQKWSFSTPNDVDASPTVVDGTVYVSSRSYGLYALDAADGSQKWSFSAGGDGMESSPTVADGTVYVSATDGYVYALDAADGSEKWSYNAGSGLSAPTVADGTVYVGGGNFGYMYAIDAADGSEKWSVRTYDDVGAPTVVDGTVYVGCSGNALCAYDAADGSEKWKVGAGGYLSSPTVADGTVYVGGSDDSNVYALDTADGSQKWSFSTGNTVQSSPTVADGTVYIGSTDNSLYALDAADGSQKWSFSTGDDIRSSPTVADGTVYVGSTDNNVYAVEASGSGADSEGSRNLLGTLGHNGLFTAGGTLDSNSLSGTVTDDNGSAIEDATVEAVDASTGETEATTTTDGTGAYEMFVESGEYDVTASGAGYSPTTKSVTVSGETTLNFTLTSDTTVSDPDPSDGATVSEPPVELSVLANSTNQSVQSIDVEFYRQTNGTVTPENDTKIGSRTVAPGERATVTWDPPPGTYRWYAVGTADSGAEDTGGPYRLGIGEADIVDGSEQPPDGANVRPTDNVDLAVDVRVQDDATVEFYDYETGNPDNDPLIGSQAVSSGTSTASTRWYSDERDASEEWYAVLSDSTGTRDTAGAFAFGAGGQVVARDAETGEVIDDRTVRFDTTYPGGSETFDRVPANLNLSKVNAEPGDRIRIDIRAKDYYERTIEVSGKQSDADVFLERGANWSYNPSSDDPDDSASVEDDPDRFISRFKLEDTTGRYPASNTTLTVRADVDGDGQSDLVHRSSFGAANRVDVRVKRDRRYQLSVENDAGDSRGLGGWTATQPDTTTLTISRVTEDIEIDQGYGVDAVVTDGTLKIYYRDYETRAERLDLEVRQYPDGPYLENRTLTDVENATITIALNESQAEKTWQVDYEGSRVGVETANISGQVTTGASGRVPLPVGSDVLMAGALVILAIVGALFTGPLSAVGSVGMVGVASVLYFIGWLPINAAALWVAAIIAVGSVLRSGGGRLG